MVAKTMLLTRASATVAAVSMMAVTVTTALAAAPQRGSETSDPWIDDCEVASIENQAVPGGDAGVLRKLNVKEGSQVKRGEDIALIDDREANAQLVVKQLDYDVAQQEADAQQNQKAAHHDANFAPASHRGSGA